MPGFFDSLQIKKRLGAMADSAGTSLLTAITPKSPFPLSTSTLTDAAGKKVRSGVDTLDEKAREKASNLQDATIGKVTTAVEDRVTSEVDAVESKVDDTVAAAEKSVDDKIDDVGKTVDGGIASANKSLDKALGRAEEKADDAPEPATAAEPEAKEGKAAPLATGWKGGSPKTRKRSNAVTIASGRARSNATAEAPAPDVEPEVASETAEEKVGDASDVAVVEGATEAKVDENSDEAVAADVDVDHEGLANTSAAERLAEEEKARAEAEAEEAAQLAGEKVDDDLPDEKDEPVDPTVAAEPEPSDADLAALGEQHKGETDDQDKARLEFKKKIRGIDNELRHLLGGALTTKSTSKDTDDPWMAFFIASNKFKKKMAVRDLKDELAGKKKDATDEGKPKDEVKTEDDGTPVVEEASGPESQDETEAEVKGGSVSRGTASKTPGEAVDTTDPELGSSDGKMIFVSDRNNKLFIAYRPVKDNQHTQLLGMDEIVVAGEIRVEQGKVDFMSNDQSGEGETADAFIALLRSLRDAGGVPMNFDVFEASKKNETTAEKLIEEADKAAPEPEQVDLLTEMKKHDAWKLIASDFSEALITQVAEKEGWKVAGEQIVDAAGPLDPDSARLTLQKAASKSFATEAAAKMAAKAAAKAAPATVDA